jgi:hypothetical protein
MKRWAPSPSQCARRSKGHDVRRSRRSPRLPARREPRSCSAGNRHERSFRTASSTPPSSETLDIHRLDAGLSARPPTGKPAPKQHLRSHQLFRASPPSTNAVRALRFAPATSSEALTRPTLCSQTRQDRIKNAVHALAMLFACPAKRSRALVLQQHLDARAPRVATSTISISARDPGPVTP